MNQDSKKLQLTQEGFDSLKKELEELVSVKRPKLVDRLSYARSQGDLSENSDYTNAKEELEFLDGRIDELTYVIENAIIAKNSTANPKIIMTIVVFLEKKFLLKPLQEQFTTKS